MNGIVGQLVARVLDVFHPAGRRQRGSVGDSSGDGGAGRRRTPLWLAVILAPFALLGILLRPLELLLQLIVTPLEWLLPKSMRGDSGFLGTVKTVVYAVAIALLIRTFAYEPFNIPSGSMKPTLLVGDYLFVSKFSYGYSDYSLGFGMDLGLLDGRILSAAPQRGDVVVFRKPTDTSVDFIKRLVGIPGDRIRMIDGILHINGSAVEQRPAAPFLDRNCVSAAPVSRYRETLPGGVSHAVLDLSDDSRLDNTGEFLVPDGHYFMMGDNRDSSNDSRAVRIVGFVPEENLIGRAEFLFFSVDGCGSLFRPWTWPSSVRWERIFRPVD